MNEDGDDDDDDDAASDGYDSLFRVHSKRVLEDTLLKKCLLSATDRQHEYSQPSIFPLHRSSHSQIHYVIIGVDVSDRVSAGVDSNVEVIRAGAQGGTTEHAS